MNERDGGWLSAAGVFLMAALAGATSCRKSVDEPAKAPASKPAPAMMIRNSEYDFGLVDPKSKHTVELAMPNPAGRRIGISKVKSECECIVGKASKASYGASEPVRMSVTFVAPAGATRYDERLVLVTDDPKRPAIPIRIKANVGLPLEAGAVWVSPEEAQSKKSIEKSVEIVNGGKKPVRLVYSTSARPGCVARVPRAPVPAGGKLAVPIIVATKELGKDAVMVDVATDMPTQPTISVAIRIGTAPASAPSDGRTPEPAPRR